MKRFVNYVKWLWLLPSLIIMILIFLFSNQPATQSSELSSGITERIVTVVYKIINLEEDEIEVLKKTGQLEGVVRKIAHMSEYFVLGIAYFLATTPWRFPVNKRLKLSFILSVSYAVSDEFHQYFIPGRSAQFTDVLIDSTGAFMGLLLVFVIIKIINYKKQVNMNKST